MKTKVVAALALLLVFSATAFAGPQFFVNFGRACGYAAAPYCQPALFYYPAYYSYGWYGAPYIVSERFSTVSPLMVYEDTPVYKVPAPTLPAQPVMVYPASTFGWRR